MAPLTYLEQFIKIISSIIPYSYKHVPQCKSYINLAEIKLSTAAKFGPQLFCQEYYDALKPFYLQLMSKDEDFFLKESEKLPILKDIKIDEVFPTLSKEVKDGYFIILANAFTTAGLAINEEIGKTANQLSGTNANPEEIGAAMQKMMPAVMNMLEPMLKGGGDGAPGGNPLLSALAGMMGGGGIPRSQNNNINKKKDRTVERLKKKINDRNSAKENLKKLL